MNMPGRLLGVAALALLAGSVHAQSNDARQAAIKQAVERAESLTQAQIQASHDVAALSQLRQIYRSQGDKQRYRWTLKQLVQLVPGSLPLKMELVSSYAQDDMKTPAYDLLLRMKGQGFGIDVSKMPQLKKIHGTEVWDYIVKNLQANLDTFGEGHKAFDLPTADLMFNALAWDPVHKQFLVGSARDGSIQHVDMSGKPSDFISSDAHNKLWSIMDMAVDGTHDRLWVASTSLVYFKGYDTDNAGHAALAEFDLRSGKLLHRYPLEGGNTFLSSLAVAPDGKVYAADGVNRVLYTLKGGSLKPFLRNPRLNDIRALAVSTDGKRLYMADTVLGIIGVELSDKKPFVLGYNPEHLVLPGIVDMHAYKNTLVITEPGMQPQRVMRLKLSDDGRKVTSAMPLDVAHPEFTGLGNGATVGDKIYYMTNDQRGKYDKYGLLKDGAVLEPVHVFESDMHFAWNESGIDTGMSEIPNAKPADRRDLLKEPTGRHMLPQKKDGNLLMKKDSGSR